MWYYPLAKKCKLPNWRRHERISWDNPAQSDQVGGASARTHSRTMVRVLSIRDDAIQSCSGSDGGRSPVASSRWVAATHVSPRSSGSRSESIESPIADSAKGCSTSSEVGRPSLDNAKSGGPTEQSGCRHWPHWQERPSELACWDPGRYSKVTENWPRSIYQWASIPSLLQNFWSYRRDWWSVRRVNWAPRR